MKSASQKEKVSEHIKFRAYKVSLKVLSLIDLFPNKKHYWSLADQVLRSTTSIAANIIEAQSASSRKDFIHFYTIALKSANETKFWLCLIKDGGKISKTKIDTILQEVIEISKILGASLLTLKGKNK